MFSVVGKTISWLEAWSTLSTILHARVFQLLKFSTKLIQAFHEALFGKLLATRKPSIKLNLNVEQTNELRFNSSWSH